MSKINQSKKVSNSSGPIKASRNITNSNENISKKKSSNEQSKDAGPFIIGRYIKSTPSSSSSSNDNNNNNVNKKLMPKPALKKANKDPPNESDLYPLKEEPSQLLMKRNSTNSVNLTENEPKEDIKTTTNPSAKSYLSSSLTTNNYLPKKNKSLEKKTKSNNKISHVWDNADDLDNVSFSSDDTVDLITAANQYLNENEDEIENKKTLMTEFKSHALKKPNFFRTIIPEFDEETTSANEQEEKSKDFSCEGIYLESCRKQKIIPTSYFLRHLKDSEIILKHHGLGATGIRPVSAALMNNSVVTKLDLSDNWLGPKGADYISRMLKENCFITDLNLSDNHLSTQGCETLRETLKLKSSITHLTLQGNNFDDSTAPILADIISNTDKLEFIDLSHNQFGEESGKLLGVAIGENSSLKHLNLSWNNIRRKGVLSIAKGLAINAYIKRFDFGWNGVSQEGAKAFLKTLKENEVLEELDLSNNRIATEGAVYIAKGLMTNQILRVLNLGLNPLESAGCFSIIKALQKNPNTKLELIDFSEIIVDKFFKEELKVFQSLFPNIQVKTGCDGVKLKPKVRTHPIIKLRNYFEKHNIKLIDFFTKFDKDGSMSMSREEFRNGVMELGINLTDEEINQLIDELDPDNDGEVNYRDTMDTLNYFSDLSNKNPSSARGSARFTRETTSNSLS